MLQNDRRICDVCGEQIAKGEKYRRVKLAPTALAMLQSSDDRDLVPTMTVNPDGTVNMDICLTCTLSMGNLAKSDTEVVN